MPTTFEVSMSLVSLITGLENFCDPPSFSIKYKQGKLLLLLLRLWHYGPLSLTLASLVILAHSNLSHALYIHLLIPNVLISEGKAYPKEWKMTTACSIYENKGKVGEPNNYIAVLSLLVWEIFLQYFG
jgi:hypothetical protein